MQQVRVQRRRASRCAEEALAGAAVTTQSDTTAADIVLDQIEAVLAGR